MIGFFGRFLVITLMGIGLCLFSIWTMRQIGTKLPYAETYLDPQNCVLPCWRGIQPGTENAKEFWHELEELNRYGGFLTYGADEVSISVMRLDMWGDIQLGDVFIAFGEPSHVLLRYAAGTGYGSVRRRQLVGAWLYYGDGLVRVESIREDDVWRLSPTMTVQRIQYYAPNPEGGVIPIGTSKWHGFGQNY